MNSRLEDRLKKLLIDRLALCKDSDAYFDFEKAFHEASLIKIQKSKQYGESAYIEDDFAAQIWSIYFNVKRKYVRMRRLVDHIVNDKDVESFEKFRSDLIDTVNYGLMGIQAIDMFKYMDKLKNKNGE